MKTLKERQLEFLEDTVNHFNSRNRGLNEHGGYSYSAGCAIGRYLDKALCKKLDSIGHNPVTGSNVFNQLPENMRELGKDFLGKIQFLHDIEEYWGENGLTIKGIKRVEVIKNKINNGEME